MKTILECSPTTTSTITPITTSATSPPTTPTVTLGTKGKVLAKINGIGEYLLFILS